MSNGNWPPGWNTWIDDEYCVGMAWTGTPDCETTFEGIEEDRVYAAIDAYCIVIGEEFYNDICFTGGSEQTCHAEGSSAHYCGHALDLWTGGWDDNDIAAVREELEGWGYSIKSRGDEGHYDHIHMSWGASCPELPE